MKRLSLMFLFLVGIVQSFGQSTSGTLTGLITDQTGAAVPKATVTLIETGKGLKFVTLTSQDGYYTHARIPEGIYRLEIAKDGFKTSIQDHVQVNVNTTVRVDTALQVGSSTQSVEVSAMNPLLETERADVTTDISQTMTENLPTIGRNVAYLQTLAPGAVRQSSNVGLGENPQQSIQISSNGQPNGARNVMLDGTDDNENVLGGNVIIPTEDSVGSFSIATSSWDAEYGRAGGALTQISTKSGTDSIHGTLFEFLQNKDTNAANPFTQPNGAPPFVFNQFGGSAGGPLRKGKLFYFGDYQGVRQRASGSAVASLPNSQMLTGDFSTYYGSGGAAAGPIPIFDPLTGNPNGSGRTQFPGNIIPTNRLNPIAVKILALLPTAGSTNGTNYVNNYVGTASTRFDTNQYSARMDAFLTDKTRAFVRYIYFGSDLYAPGVYGQLAGGASLGVGGGVGGDSVGNNQDVAANYSHIFSPDLLFDARFGWSRYGVNNLQPDDHLNTDTQVGLSGINDGSLTQSGLSTININGPGSLSMGGGITCNCPLYQTMNYFQWAANVTRIVDRHTFKVGADVRRYHNLRVSDDQTRGTFVFSNANTGSFDVDSQGGISGSGLASMLLDQVNNWSQQANIQENIGNEFEYHLFGYGQDSWKVTPKLTVNYGVRYEIYTPPSTPRGAGSNFDPNTGLVEIAGIGQVSNRVNVTTNFLNFGPRLAAAYQVLPKTVIRLGYARSYFPDVFNILISGNYPLISTAQYVPLSTYQTTFTLESQRPAPVFPTIPASGEFPLPVNQSITYNPSHRPTGYTNSFNFTVEQAFGSSMSLSAGYVGTLGRDLYYNIPINDPVPGPGPSAENRPLYAKFGFTNDIGNRTNATHANYNSLQTQFNRRASRDLTIIASYAWSKTIDFGEYNVVANPYDINQDRAVADYDRGQIFTLAHVFEVPFGKGRRFGSDLPPLADTFLGGWQFSGISGVSSGLPFSVVDASKSTLNSDFTLRPDLVGNPHVAHQSAQEWFNPSAFATPGLYRQGTAPRNFLRGPDLYQTDWSVAKKFFWEGYNLEFRTDAFNAFNVKSLANPSNTFGAVGAGKITNILSSTNMRKLQFGLHLRF